MRKLLYYILYPIIWVLEGFSEFSYDCRKNGFKIAVWHVWIDIKESIYNFFWDTHFNGIFGPGGHTWRTFKSGNLALLIAILTAIAFILYIILN